MLKVYSSKIAQNSWFDEIRDVDWLDDDDRPYMTPDPTPPGIDPPDEGIIDENNYTDYLSDELDQPETPTDQFPEETFLDEIPIGNEDLLEQEDARQVNYNDPMDLINDARSRQEVISFEYVNRHGAYAGWRTVEPHYIFLAETTGNLVLVGWDRGVGDIRAFIIGKGAGPVVDKDTDASAGIQPGGVRYEDENFELRPEILSS